jgi:hypothetical protein
MLRQLHTQALHKSHVGALCLLQAVVEEISSLANPDYLQSIQIKASQE